MGRVKYSFIPKNDIRRTNILRPSKRYLLRSYNVNDVTERAPRDDNGNVMLMAQVAKEDFVLHFATKLLLQSCKQLLHSFEYQIKTVVNSEIM